jgi:hypothetical protein
MDAGVDSKIDSAAVQFPLTAPLGSFPRRRVDRREGTRHRRHQIVSGPRRAEHYRLPRSTHAPLAPSGLLQGEASPWPLREQLQQRDEGAWSSQGRYGLTTRSGCKGSAEGQCDLRLPELRPSR